MCFLQTFVYSDSKDTEITNTSYNPKIDEIKENPQNHLNKERELIGTVNKKLKWRGCGG